MIGFLSVCIETAVGYFGHVARGNVNLHCVTRDWRATERRRWWRCCCCCCHDEPVPHLFKTSLSPHIGGQRCPEEMRNSTRLWIQRDPSLPCDSWQPFYWLGHHSRVAVVAHSWHIVDHCQTMNVDGCWQTVKLSRWHQALDGEAYLQLNKMTDDRNSWVVP